VTSPRNAKTTNRGRTYTWPGDDPPITYDSVTTVLSGGVPKPALPSWAAKSVAEWAVSNVQQVLDIIETEGPGEAVRILKGKPWSQRDRAADLGSRCHDAAEAYVLGKPMPEWEEDVKPYMASFCAFLEDFRPTYELTEATVYNRRYSYAGTLDFIARIGDELILGDIKTGKGVYDEVALQLAAYRYAEFIGLPDGTEAPLPVVDAVRVLHLTPRRYELIPVEAGEAQFRTFLYAQQVHGFCKSADVLGLPIPRPGARPVAEPNVAALVD
jgi:hypothetical protein